MTTLHEQIYQELVADKYADTFTDPSGWATSLSYLLNLEGHPGIEGVVRHLEAYVRSDPSNPSPLPEFMRQVMLNGWEILPALSYLDLDIAINQKLPIQTGAISFTTNMSQATGLAISLAQGYSLTVVTDTYTEDTTVSFHTLVEGGCKETLIVSHTGSGCCSALAAASYRFLLRKGADHVYHWHIPTWVP